MGTAAAGAGVFLAAEAQVGVAVQGPRAVAEFRAGSRIGRNTVLMIDNRPGQLNKHEVMIRDQYTREMEALRSLVNSWHG